MKNLKIYEDFRDIKVGDIVISTDTLPKNKKGSQLITGRKYKVLDIDINGYAEVEELDGTYQGYYLKVRFLPVHEYIAKNYNL